MMDQEFNENHEVASSRTVYHVTVKFSQRSFTLSLKQHIRNACNALEFTFPTTKEFYDSVQEGEELDSKFKSASFIFGGHVGSRTVTVVRKFIQEEPVLGIGED